VRRGALDATGRLFAIDSIEFAEAPPPPGFPEISAHLVIDAFVFGTGTAPTVPGPTGAPTTGATGTTGPTGPTTTAPTTTTPAPTDATATPAGT
jgi:hypothetical protein